jgi:DNA polymerase-3 subunit epsilon
MNYVIIDLETTGKEKNSRIVQIAIIVCDDKYQIVKEVNYIIKRDGFNISNSHIHNITNEISDIGISFTSIIPEINDILLNSAVILAHNIEFDINVLINELYRYNAQETIILIQSKQIICTMKKTRSIVGAKDKIGRLKNPKLGELYEFCYPTLKFVEKHEAGHDVRTVFDILKVIGDKIIVGNNSVNNNPKQPVVKVITENTIVPFGKYRGKKVNELPLDYIIYLQNVQNPYENVLPFIKYFENRLGVITPLFTGTITNRVKYINHAMYTNIINNVFSNKLKTPVVNKLGLDQMTMKFIQEIRKIDSRFCGVYIETLFNLCIQHLAKSSETKVYRTDPVIYPELIITTLDFLDKLSCNDCSIIDYELCDKHKDEYIQLVPNTVKEFSDDLSLINDVYNLEKLKILKRLGIYDRNDAFTIALRFAIQTDDFHGNDFNQDNIRNIINIIQRSNRSEILNNLLQIIKTQFSDLSQIQIHKSFTRPFPVELDILYNNHIIEIKCISLENYYKSILQLLAQSYCLDKPGIISIFNFNTNEKISINVENICKDDIKRYLNILDNKSQLDTTVIDDLEKDTNTMAEDTFDDFTFDMEPTSDNTFDDLTFDMEHKQLRLPFNISRDLLDDTKPILNNSPEFAEFVKVCNKKINKKNINITYDSENISIKFTASHAGRSWCIQQKRIDDDISLLLEMLGMAYIKYYDIGMFDF